MYVVGSGLSQGLAGGYIPRVRVEGSSPGVIRSALDRDAEREPGVKKQIPDILQLLLHRVYDVFPPARDTEVLPQSPASGPIFSTSSALTSRRYDIPQPYEYNSENRDHGDNLFDAYGRRFFFFFKG